MVYCHGKSGHLSLCIGGSLWGMGSVLCSQGLTGPADDLVVLGPGSICVEDAGMGWEHL